MYVPHTKAPIRATGSNHNTSTGAGRGYGTSRNRNNGGIGIKELGQRFSVNGNGFTCRYTGGPNFDRRIPTSAHHYVRCIVQPQGRRRIGTSLDQIQSGHGITMTVHRRNGAGRVDSIGQNHIVMTTGKRHVTRGSIRSHDQAGQRISGRVGSVLGQFARWLMWRSGCAAARPRGGGSIPFTTTTHNGRIGKSRKRRRKCCCPRPILIDGVGLAERYLVHEQATIQRSCC
mmetsp:Transcript_34088/g.70899  ORF Transcript_34088/g.70899 Transcript_34088/m.70899 type:complete len:230 (+) Transcript_34088:96-785(+)